MVASLPPPRRTFDAQHVELADQATDYSIAGHAGSLPKNNREQTKAGPVASVDTRFPESPANLELYSRKCGNPMCDKCVGLDEKIERYRKLAFAIIDPLTA